MSSERICGSRSQPPASPLRTLRVRHMSLPTVWSAVLATPPDQRHLGYLSASGRAVGRLLGAQDTQTQAAITGLLAYRTGPGQDALHRRMGASTPGLANHSAGTVDVYGLQILDARRPARRRRQTRLLLDGGADNVSHGHGVALQLEASHREADQDHGGLAVGRRARWTCRACRLGSVFSRRTCWPTCWRHGLGHGAGRLPRRATWAATSCCTAWTCSPAWTPQAQSPAQRSRPPAGSKIHLWQTWHGSMG